MREILTIRNQNVERLLASMPYELGDDAPDIRRFTVALTRDASQFERDRAKRNALAKGQRHA